MDPPVHCWLGVHGSQEPAVCVAKSSNNCSTQSLPVNPALVATCRGPDMHVATVHVRLGTEVPDGACDAGAEVDDDNGHADRNLNGIHVRIGRDTGSSDANRSSKGTGLNVLEQRSSMWWAELFAHPPFSTPGHPHMNLSGRPRREASSVQPATAVWARAFSAPLPNTGTSSRAEPAADFLLWFRRIIPDLLCTIFGR